MLRRIGTTGLTTVPLALGAMNLGSVTAVDESTRIVDAALEAGVTLIDTADVYGDGVGETTLGQILASNGRRARVLLASKVGMAFAPDMKDCTTAIIAGCEASLRRLSTDHLDLLQLHKPLPDADPDSICTAFDQLQRSGKIRHGGSTTHPAWLLAEQHALAQQRGAAPWVSEQPAYNLLDRRVEQEVIPWCQRSGVAVLPWSPLGGGILAGRYADGIPSDARAARKQAVRDRVTPAAVEVARQVARIADDHGLTSGQAALLWLRDRPGVTAPIIGPRTLGQLIEALATLSLRLDAATTAAIDALVPAGTHVADFHNTVSWSSRRHP